MFGRNDNSGQYDVDGDSDGRFHSRRDGKPVEHRERHRNKLDGRHDTSGARSPCDGENVHSDGDERRDDNWD